MRVFQPGSYFTVDFAKKKILTIQLLDEVLPTGMLRQDIKVASFGEGDALKSEIEHFLDHIGSRETNRQYLDGRPARPRNCLTGYGSD